MASMVIDLKDWSSEDKLLEDVDPTVQHMGRTPSLRTNVRIERLLADVLDLSFYEVSATTVFPII